MIKSDHEQFAQGALSLTKNEQFAQKCFNKIVFLCSFFISFCKVFFKTSDSLIPSFLKSNVSKSLRSLTTKGRL